MIEETIDAVVQRTPAISGDNLLGFRMDLDLALMREPLFASSSIMVTSDPRTHVHVIVEIGREADSLQSVALALERLWATTAYRSFKASSVFMTRQEIVLRFVTAVAGGLYHVTGEFTASHGPYAHLVTLYERDFGRLPDAR